MIDYRIFDCWKPFPAFFANVDVCYHPSVVCLSSVTFVRLNAQYLPSYCLDRKSCMSFWLVPIISDIEWPSTAKWPLFGSFRGVL